MPGAGTALEVHVRGVDKVQIPLCSFFLNFFYEHYAAAYSGLMVCLHGGGGPQVGEVTCGRSPHLSCKRDQIKMRDYMGR